MDNPKFGEAIAKTMDRLDRMETRGDLNEAVLEHVLVISVWTRPSDDRDEVDDDLTETLITVDGTTVKAFEQLGILELAKDTVMSPLIGPTE